MLENTRFYFSRVFWAATCSLASEKWNVEATTETFIFRGVFFENLSNSYVEVVSVYFRETVSVVFRETYLIFVFVDTLGGC